LKFTHNLSHLQERINYFYIIKDMRTYLIKVIVF